MATHTEGARRERRRGVVTPYRRAAAADVSLGHVRDTRGAVKAEATADGPTPGATKPADGDGMMATTVGRGAGEGVVRLVSRLQWAAARGRSWYGTAALQVRVAGGG